MQEQEVESLLSVARYSQDRFVQAEGCRKPREVAGLVAHFLG
jgi:hypothetical protein